MPQISPNRKLSRVVLCMFLGVGLIVAGSVAVHAGDEDDDLPDVKLIKRFLRGLGLRNGEEAGIEYQERPPLVVPPTRDLPPPVSADAMAPKSAAWPSDPDEKRRAAARKARRENRASFDPETAGNNLLPDQLAGRTDKPPTQTSDPDHPREMTPKELGFKNSMWKTMIGLGKTFTGQDDIETSTFVREPTRNALTDPPAGYLTPSPSQPYGINAKADAPRLSGKRDSQTDDFGK